MPWYTFIFWNSDSLFEEFVGISLELPAIFKGHIHGLFLAQARLLSNLRATLADLHSFIQGILRRGLLF